jgi:hypothetical protein
MSKFKTVLEDIEIIESVKKHGTHDQKTHGNWATGATPNSITTTTNAIGQEIQTITYGDIVIERNKPGEVRDNSDQSRFMWTYRAGNDAMRIVASRIMGTENPNIRTPELSDAEIKSLVEGKVYPSGSMSADAMKSGIEKTISATYTLLEDARASAPMPIPLFRGITVANGSPATSIKVGDSFTMPLSATTNQQELAERYARPRETAQETPMVFTFKEGTKATPVRHNSDTTGSTIYSEYVTQGKFRVVSVDKSSLVMDGNNRVSGYIKVEVEHTEVYSIDKGNYEPVKP